MGGHKHISTIFKRELVRSRVCARGRGLDGCRKVRRASPSCWDGKPGCDTSLAWESDRWRRKSETGSVRISEWKKFADHAKYVFHQYGIQARPWQPETRAAG